MNIKPLENYLKNKVKAGCQLFAKEWETENKKVALIGPTGNLKSSMECVVTEKKDFIQVELKALPSAKGYPYARRQAQRTLRHVPLKSVGKLGFHSYISERGLSRLQRYRKGYRMARKGFYPIDQFKYNFPRLTLETIGGLDELKRLIIVGK
jgi:hypothetical protein